VVEGVSAESLLPDGKLTTPYGLHQERRFERYFIHRTGHSIGTEVHANGANMDDLEIHDDVASWPTHVFDRARIYLPEFGVRSE